MEIKCPHAWCNRRLKQIKTVDINDDLMEIVLFCPGCKQEWHLTNNDIDFMEEKK